ncbi:MAG: cupredoxin domain-containing protein [Methylocapsa sp.]|nr:cupredoxin domain-containing protein [Methylocapsa sp.]
MIANNPRPRLAVVFAAASLTLFGAARAQTAAPAANAAAPGEITIIATEFKYTPAKVWAAAGRPVTLVLDNSRAETEHGIVIPAFELRLVAKPGEVTRATAVFDKPGEYEFSCDLPGHREAGMTGKLIVTRS